MPDVILLESGTPFNLIYSRFSEEKEGEILQTKFILSSKPLPSPLPNQTYTVHARFGNQQSQPWILLGTLPTYRQNFDYTHEYCLALDQMGGIRLLVGEPSYHTTEIAEDLLDKHGNLREGLVLVQSLSTQTTSRDETVDPDSGVH
jgi:hypothetical protein